MIDPREPVWTRVGIVCDGFQFVNQAPVVIRAGFEIRAPELSAMRLRDQQC